MRESYEKNCIDVDNCGRSVSASDGLRDKKSAAKVQKGIFFLLGGEGFLLLTGQRQEAIM